MLSPTSRNAWIAALVALFMVLVLPACWYGALARARIANLTAPSNANSNEERHDHEEPEEAAGDVATQRPPDRPTASRPTLSTPVQRAHAFVRIAASVVDPELPSKLSERRLI